MINKLVLLQGMPHCGKTTMKNNLQKDFSLVSFSFDSFHISDNFYTKFPELSEEGLANTKKACEVIFRSIVNTPLNAIVEGVDLQSEYILSMFVCMSDIYKVDCKIFRLVLLYDEWYKRVPEGNKDRRTKLYYDGCVKYPENGVIIIKDSKPIEDFLRS